MVGGERMVSERIVFVIGNYKNGGVAMRSTNLANAFASRGYKVTILVTSSISNDVYFYHNANVDVVVLSEYIMAHNDDALVLKYKKNQNNAIKLYKRLRYLTRFLPKFDSILADKVRSIRIGNELSSFAVNNQDSIYIPFGIGCYEKTFYATKPFNSKIIYAERNASEVEFPQDVAERNKLIRLVGKADGVILQTKNELEFYGGVLKNPMVINNPVKVDLPGVFVGERRKVIVNFCRVSEQKNLPLLFAAMEKLHSDYPEYILEIYGNTVVPYEEALCEEYKQLIKTMGAESYIKILPPSKEVHNIVRDCAMFVSSSDFEGLSNSMIEAMAIGLPCVCTDCLGGGAREMITDSENGLLVPINNAEALYCAMKRFIEEPDLAIKCSQNATKKRVELSIDVIADKWIDYIESVV